MARRVLSVGHCGMDQRVLSWFLDEHFGAEVAPALTEADAIRQLKQAAYDLVLVNRRLDADGASGVDIIHRLKSKAEFARIPMMLVSNFADAQAAAVESGAVPGFGKSEYGDPTVVDRLRPFLGVLPSAGSC